MAINTIDDSLPTATKIAGLSCLLTMAIVVFANYGLLNPLIVPGNAAETARNIVAHERQFRITVTCVLIYSVDVVVILAALYVIVSQVNRGLALVGALFRLVFALLWLLTTLTCSAFRLAYLCRSHSCSSVDSLAPARSAVKARPSMSLAPCRSILVRRFTSMSRFIIIFFTVALLPPPLALAKRAAPAKVESIIHQGIRYIAPNDDGRRAYIEAWGVRTDKKLWDLTVFTNRIDPNLEEDVQHVFIKTLRVRDGTLIVTSERGEIYRVDLKTKGVTKSEQPNTSLERAARAEILALENQRANAIVANAYLNATCTNIESSLSSVRFDLQSG